MILEALETAVREGFVVGRSLKADRPSMSKHGLKMYITTELQMPWVARNAMRPGYKHAWEVYRAALIAGYES